MNSVLFYESSLQYTEGSRPDKYIPGLSASRPEDNFIISKKPNGSVLSRYGDNVWFLWPYATVPKKTSPLIFSGFCDKIRADIKWLMFILIYMANTGRANTLSPGTFTQYMSVLNRLILFSSVNNTTPIEVLGTTALLKKFVLGTEDKVPIIKLLAPLLTHIFLLGIKITGINVVGKKVIDEIRQFYRYHKQVVRQYAVIPPRIFSHLLTQYWYIIDMIDAHKDNLSQFIKHCASNNAYACSRKKQRSLGLRNKKYAPFFNEAVKTYGLVELFMNFKVNCFIQFFRFLTQVQHACKELIHAYSGMRNSEVLSLKIDCLRVEKNQHDKIVHLLGKTSKLIGQRKTTVWVTSHEIIKAVDLAKAIALAIAYCKGFKIKVTPLFVSVSYLSFGIRKSTIEDEININSSFNKKYNQAFNLINSVLLKIVDTDIQHLEKIDPLRAWREEPEFQIGETWNVTTHQWRRSLAFYVAQSGLVSLPTLKRQLQHITREMSVYYSKGAGFSDLFNNVKHFRQELVNTKPEADALAYIYNVLLSDEPFQGAHGHQIKQYCNVDTDVKLFENRKKTIAMFKKGELAYKETPLGVCTSVEPCNKKLLRSLAACFSCPSAGIKPSKVARVVDRQQRLVEQLDDNSVEYRTEKGELENLLLLQQKITGN